MNILNRDHHFDLFDNIFLSWIYFIHSIVVILFFSSSSNFLITCAVTLASSGIGYFLCEAILHRYACHKSFDVNSYLSVIIRLMIEYVTLGSSEWFCRQHIAKSHVELIVDANKNRFNLPGGIRIVFVAASLLGTIFLVCLKVPLFKYVIFFTSFSTIVYLTIQQFSKFSSTPVLLMNHLSYPGSPFVNFNTQKMDWVWLGIRRIQRNRNCKSLYYKISELEILRASFQEDLRRNNYEWHLYSNNNHKDVYLSSAPSFVKKIFNKNFWDDCGYAKTFENHFVPPHVDLGLNNHLGQLDRASGRKCAIFFPISGSFLQVPIKFYDFSLNYLDSVCVDVPTLVNTGDACFHSVDNRGFSERVFFCLNFYGDKDFDVVISWLKEEGYIVST